MLEKLERIRIVIVALFGGLLILMASEAHSEVCKWADDSWKTHFSDQPPTDSIAEMEDSEKGKHDLKKHKGKGIPLILVDHQRMSGFNVQRFKKRYEQDS